MRRMVGTMALSARGWLAPLAVFLSMVGPVVAGERPVCPIKVSDNGRYFADQEVKPVLMAEGAYEQGSEYGFDVSPLWIRRQAYYSYLAGAHHTYGHNDSWRVLPTWKQALDAPGAVQLGILKKVFLGLGEWWYLVPDQSIFAAGSFLNTGTQSFSTPEGWEDAILLLESSGS